MHAQDKFKLLYQDGGPLHIPDPKSVTPPGKVFGGFKPSKKKLKQLNRMRVYLKADILGMDLPEISKEDLRILKTLRTKNNI